MSAVPGSIVPPSRFARVLRAATQAHETRWTFSVAATAVYFAYLVWAHLHHEFWRDEIHPWSLARGADSFFDVLVGDRVYEGHPPLWFWYLRLWSLVVRGAAGLHAANVAAMTVAALLFTRFAPFARPIKLLLLFSYFIGFEYGVMSRNYTLAWLLVVVFCTALHPLRPRFITLAIVLGLLCITSAYGTLLAGGLVLTVVSLGASLKVTSGPSAPVPAVDARVRPGVIVALVIVAMSALFSLYSTSPPDPNPFSPGWSFSSLSGKSVVEGMIQLLYTFLPVRSFHDPEYWSHVDRPWWDHQAVLLPGGAAITVLLALALVPRWSLVITFVATLLLIFVFQIVRYPGTLRHWGHYFMLFIALCWIARRAAPRRKHVLSSALLVVIGGFQVESFLAAAWRDHHDVFAGGEATADFIRHAGLADLPIVAGPAHFVLSVTSYLDRPFMSSESEEVSTTVVFHNRRKPFSEAGLLSTAADEARRKRSRVLVIADRPVSTKPPNGAQLKALYHYPGVLCMTNERFYVYALDVSR